MPIRKPSSSLPKNEWISQMISTLEKEGRWTHDQCVAMAHRYYEDMLEEKHAKKLSDFLPIPILRVGQTKNRNMKITKQILAEAKETLKHKVHKVPIVKKPHEDYDAGIAELGREGEAMAWVDDVDVIAKDGVDWLCITQAHPSNQEYDYELGRLLSGPMPYNSPELDLADRLELEFYNPEKTNETWPDEIKGKYHLRRVCLYGDQPVAQFSQPAAGQMLCSESGDEFFKISQENPMKTKTTVKLEDEQKPDGAPKGCTGCGEPLVEGKKFCANCGQSVNPEEPVKEEEKPKVEEPKVDPPAAAATATPPPATEAKAPSIEIQLAELQDWRRKEETEKRRLKIELAEKDRKLKELAERESIREEERLTERVENEVDDMIALEQLPASCRSRAIAVLKLAEKQQPVLTLAEPDGKELEEDLGDSVRFLLRNSYKALLAEPHTGASRRIAVAGEKRQPRLTLAEQEEKAFSEVADELKLDRKKSADQDKIAYEVRKRFPHLYQKREVN